MLVARHNRSDIGDLKKTLKTEFDMKDFGSAKKILGMQILRDRQKGTVFLAQ